MHASSPDGLGLPTLLSISLGLAMDAFAVSVTSGLAIRTIRVRHALRIAAFFGAFQGVMPVVGWLAGTSLRSSIAPLDHWLAFGILGVVGGKMIYEAAVIEKAEESAPSDLGILVLLGLSVATSLDALAVGVTFAFLDVRIVTPALVIGAVTFAMSYAGVWIGDRFGGFFEKKIEVLGGIILIAIGLKILTEHLFFGK
jgi:putative Mn2+ efflux pump MntP